MPYLLEIAVVFIAALTAVIILLSSDWRYNSLMLAVQYLMAFVLLAIEWPFFYALSIMTAGWISLAVLGMTILYKSSNPKVSESGPPPPGPPPLLLNMLFSMIMIFVVSSLPSHLVIWIPNLEPIQIWLALFLFGIGLVNLSSKSQPPDLVITLLMIITAFEILFSGLMINPTLLTFLVSISLLIALAGAYLINSPSKADLF